MLPKSSGKFVKGQADHIDAWFMSYADLITLLFMFFVIFVSITYSRPSNIASNMRGEPEHPVVALHSGTLALDTPFNDTYQSVMGTIVQNGADQDIAVEKTDHGLKIDMATPLSFKPDSAEIREESAPLLSAIARALKATPADTDIEIAAYTDDEPPERKAFNDNWEMTSLQAAHMARFMADEGVDPAKLHTASFASNRPLVPNLDLKGNPILENRLRNQRVVITLEKTP